MGRQCQTQYCSQELKRAFDEYVFTAYLSGPYGCWFQLSMKNVEKLQFNWVELVSVIFWEDQDFFEHDGKQTSNLKFIYLLLNTQHTL